jgi:hypothetical protein
MNSTALSLALRIAQLLEEHSETELQEALSLLERHGLRSELLDYLAQRKADSRASRPKRKSESTRPRLEDTTSRAVLRLRDSDPDKFRLLSEFDLMVRRGQVLATLEDLKRFGERIRKDFQPRKSRKETVGVLLSTLAERSLSEIEKLMEFAATFGVAGDTDEYQRLAQFLIKGRRAEG